MSFRRKAVVLAVNLLVFLLLAEVVSLGAYFWETGALYYTHEPDREVPATSERVEEFRIHPYFGYVWQPGTNVPPRRNNHGFVSDVDYPFDPRRADGEEALVIGIFGGSLAANLATYEVRHDVLRQRLASRLGRSAEEFKVLNFAQAGYKQPQQLLVATYFRTLGQRIDLAISVDGFNELALGTGNALSGSHHAMPSLSHIGPLREVVGFTGSSSEGLLRMAKIRNAWDAFGTHYERAWSRTGWETHTASGFLFNWLLCKFHLIRYQRAFAEHVTALDDADEPRSWLYLEAIPDVDENDERAREAAMDRAVAHWARAARDFHHLQTAAGDSYLQVLQPNQYFQTKRVFSPEEASIAFSEESPFAPFIPPGYPRLEAALDDLRLSGVRAWSATRLFDDVAEPVYRDDCCHLNDLGHELLAKRLADLSAEALADDEALSPD